MSSLPLSVIWATLVMYSDEFGSDRSAPAQNCLSLALFTHNPFGLLTIHLLTHAPAYGQAEEGAYLEVLYPKTPSQYSNFSLSVPP
jgi:hypothetical protein